MCMATWNTFGKEFFRSKWFWIFAADTYVTIGAILITIIWWEPVRIGLVLLSIFGVYLVIAVICLVCLVKIFHKHGIYMFPRRKS